MPRPPRYKASWIIVPNTHCPPGDKIVCGSIITDPFKPQTPLSSGGAVPPLDPASVLKSYVEDNWKRLLGTKHAGSIGIYAQALTFLGAGGDVEAGWNRDETTQYQFERLESEELEPSVPYLNQSLLVPAIAQFIHNTRFEKDLYMIVSTKAAYGAQIAGMDNRGHDFKIQVGVSGTAFGAPGVGEAGPKGSSSVERMNEYEYSVKMPFVFAYRLRRIQYSKRRDVFRQSEFTKGAAFSLEEDEGAGTGDVDASGEMVVGVDGLDAEDVGADDLEVDGVEVVDELEERMCECILPPLVE